MLNVRIERRDVSARGRRAWAALLCMVLALVVARAEATTGPVGWWKFDEGTGSLTADSSGNGSAGTLVNSPAWAAGRVGPGSLTFSGTTQYVNLPNTSGSLSNLALSASGMSVSAWIKVSGAGAGGRGRIVEMGGWFFCTYGSGTTVQLQFASQDTGGNRISAATIPVNTWVHVLATWTGSTSGTGMSIYINGALSNGTATAGSGTLDTNDTGAMNIGNRASDLARALAGSVDEVRVYNRTLSTTEIQALADSTVPSAPTAPSAAAASSSQLNLSWTASTDNVGVTGYLIERCQGSGCSSFSQVGTTTATSYSDMGLAASTLYLYRVRATDANTNYSSYSTTVSATTAASTPPPTPAAVTYKYDSLGRLQQASYDTGTVVAYTLDPAGNRTNVFTGAATPLNFTATAASTTQINLSWTAVPQATGYKLYRSGSSTPFATPTATSFNDTGLSPYTSYPYVLVATYPSGAVSGQATASATTLALPPNPPTTVTATAASQTAINVTWSGATDPSGPGISQYGVYRDGTQVGTTASTSYSDSGLAGWSTHSYYIVTYDRSTPALVSSASSTATARTLDTTAPGTPTNFAAAVGSSTQANLSWTASTDTGGSGLAGYAIYTALDANGRVTGIPYTTTGTSYSVTGLAPGSTHTYYLEAYDTAGNYSAYTSATVTLPFTVENLVMTERSSSYMTLVCNGYISYAPGVGCPPMGGISPSIISGGLTVLNWYDGGNAILLISGFSADPGKTWLVSAYALGITNTGAAATYSYSGGMAQWTWSTKFGFTYSSTANVSLNHH